MQVQLTSHNYFMDFVPEQELFKYDPSLMTPGDPEHFDKYYKSEDESDIDDGLEIEAQNEEEELFVYSQKIEKSIQGIFFYLACL